MEKALVTSSIILASTVIMQLHEKKDMYVSNCKVVCKLLYKTMRKDYCI